MRWFVALYMILFSLVSPLLAEDGQASPGQSNAPAASPTKINMPKPDSDGLVPIEQVLQSRGSDVKFSGEGATFGEVAQLLWAGYGITDEQNQIHTVDSQDKAYSLALYVVTTGNAYRYSPSDNTLIKVVPSDIRSKLAVAAGRDRNIMESVLNIVIAGSSKQAGYKVPKNSRKYMYMEAGRAAQNIELQAVAMNMAAISTANIDADKIRALLKMPAEYEPVAVLTVDKVEPDTSYAFKLPKSVVKEAVQEPVKRKRVVVIIPSSRLIEEDYFAVEQTLRTSRIDFDLASSTLDPVRGELRGTVSPNLLINDVYASDYDAVILIGGLTTLKQYDDERLVADVVGEFYDEDRLVAAVGRTPKILGMANVVRGLTVTSHNSQRKNLERAGATWLNVSVEVSDNIITAQGALGASTRSSSEGAASSTRFASEIVRYLQEPADEDEDTREEVEYQPFIRREERVRRRFE